MHAWQRLVAYVRRAIGFNQRQKPASGSKTLGSYKRISAKPIVHGTRTRRAMARLRSYAIRGRVTAEVRLLDDGALARVKLYHSLFGLPHVLFKEVVSKL